MSLLVKIPVTLYASVVELTQLFVDAGHCVQFIVPQTREEPDGRAECEY
jgi:hypothetical protein